MSSVVNVLKKIKEQGIEYVDLRFTDTPGKEHHVTIPAHLADKDFFTEGKMFDGSSLAGWREIHESDMVLMPDASTAVLDPFFEAPTLNVRCDVYEPGAKTGYVRDPRSLAARAEAYLQTTGIGDTVYFGPELEFFIFDDVRWDLSMRGNSYQIDSDEAAWNSKREYEGGNYGHRPRVKGGYFPVPPVDSSQDLRAHMCDLMAAMGLKIETHHHEVATANQNEIGVGFNTLLTKADEVQIYKYVVHNVAHQYAKTATFMPKPLMNDNGSGMHCHQSIMKNGKNIFAGKEYAGLSKEALYYIGGIIKHAKALNAITNASTNSYKRLVPGYEAPVLLAYSACNRSASIRIPYNTSPKAQRIEVRFPDATANPYLAFAAMLMAGLDGIRNKISPGAAMDHNLYALPPKELAKVPTVAASLDEALNALDRDRAFLTQGGVFTDEVIDSYIAIKREHVDILRTTVHPVEFELYYSV